MYASCLMVCPNERSIYCNDEWVSVFTSNFYFKGQWDLAQIAPLPFLKTGWSAWLWIQDSSIHKLPEIMISNTYWCSLCLYLKSSNRKMTLSKPWQRWNDLSAQTSGKLRHTVHLRSVLDCTTFGMKGHMTIAKDINGENKKVEKSISCTQ